MSDKESKSMLSLISLTYRRLKRGGSEKEHYIVIESVGQSVEDQRRGGGGGKIDRKINRDVINIQDHLVSLILLF